MEIPKASGPLAGIRVLDLTVNCNKRGLAVNLKAPEGREIAQRWPAARTS